MASTDTNTYAPDYAVHPGEILDETLFARGIKKADFAERCGLTAKTVSQIINGKAPVTPETAIQFERVLGVSADVWNNLEAFYRLYEAKIVARKKLENQKAWADRFPVKELVRRELIKKPANAVEKVEGLLNFFAVGSTTAWEERFRRMSIAYRRSPSYKIAPESVATWLRIGELIAETIDTLPYNRVAFQTALREIRRLTNKPQDVFELRMKDLCRKAGVAVVFVSELPGTHLSGATRWLNKNKALIMQSLRHKRDDHFWFTFFHEAGHILHHGKKEVFIDEGDIKLSSRKEEKKVNRFTANFLIPEDKYKHFLDNTDRLSKKAVSDFAADMGIAPGIVVGRLQFDKIIPYSWLNGLTRKFVICESKT